MSTSTSKVVAWAKQPTTIAGFSTICGTAVAVLSAQLSWQAAIPVIAGGVIAMILPDNSAAKSGVVAAVTDAITAEEAIVQPHAGATVNVITKEVKQ